MASADRSGPELFADAVAHTATAISDVPASFLESKIEAGLVAALGDSLGAQLVSGPTTFPVPDWTDRLGSIDLVVRHRPDGDLRFGAELKVDDIEDTLWDLFKMTAVTSIPDVEGTFLVAAAPRRRWASDRDCVALFPPEPEAATRWSSEQLFKRWRGAWEGLTGPKGGSARPVRVPRTIETAFVASHAVRAYPTYGLRCIAVRPILADGWLSFNGDWPSPIAAS